MLIGTAHPINIVWVLGDPSLGINLQEREANSSHPAPMFRINGAIPPTLHIFVT
jgi:hypothetical protein